MCVCECVCECVCVYYTLYTHSLSIHAIHVYTYVRLCGTLDNTGLYIVYVIFIMHWYTAQYTVYIIQCTLIVHCTLYSIHTLYSVQLRLILYESRVGG